MTPPLLWVIDLEDKLSVRQVSTNRGLTTEMDFSDIEGVIVVDTI